MATPAVAQKSNIERLKTALSADSVKEQFQNALAENSGPFVASVIDLYGSDTYLQNCDPSAVVMECLKAATLKLPINKQLGFAYVVPYGNKPQFQLGYKGYIQLAMRTGQYRFLNAGMVYEGQMVDENPLTGATKIAGSATSDTPIGYFAHMELLNGFTKTVYMTKTKVTAHGKKHSASFSKSTSPWKTDFDAMARKTVVRALLSKWGIMSIDMQKALESDVVAEVANEIGDHANKRVLDMDPETGELLGDQNPAEPRATGPEGEPIPTQEEIDAEQASLVDPGF